MRVRSLPLVLLFLLLLLCSAVAAQAQPPQWGRLYDLTGDVSVRESPSDDSLQVRKLRAGQKVRVDFQEDGWTAVFDPKERVRSELRALGYARLAELNSHGALEFAQATSIEVRRPGSDAKPEVTVDGKPEAKPEVRPDAKAAKSGAKTVKPASKPKKEEPKKQEAKDFGEIRVADRQLSVRARRDKDSDFVHLLKAGQRVRVDFLEDGWYAVFPLEEKTRDLARAWGYSRDKFLVPESDYAGPPAAEQPAPKAAAPAVLPAKTPQRSKAEAAGDDVGYSVLERKDDHHKPVSGVTLRVRLDLTQPPASDAALRKIAREIWKAERKKNEDLRLEVYLTGMDSAGLAYAVAKFHEDGRLREFWWRDVVLGKGKK